MRRYAIYRKGALVARNIINLPLEPLEQRYTIEWRKWFEEHMKPSATIDGEMLTTKIENGAFLDICGTNYFKSAQLQKTIKFIHSMKDQSDMRNFVFFTHDVWHTGIEALAYIRDGLKLKFKIAGCLHAGTYDKFDPITMMGMGYWGKDYENSLFRIFDYIFVATEWHKRQLIHSRDVEPNKIHVTGFPIYNERAVLSGERENIIVSPNRLSKDKNPQLFRSLKQWCEHEPFFKDWKFVTTFQEDGTYLSKKEYWKLLHESKVMISFADHENWGISTQEALFAGCFIVVPNKLSYVELYHPAFRYNNFHDLMSILKDVILAWEGTSPLWELRENDKGYALKRGREAIPNMLRIMNDE
jgi:hypothetical protein